MIRPILRAAAQRVRHAAWRIMLASVTAALAWWFARLLLDEQLPIFAPIAAMVSLLDEPGVRGRRAFRLLGGVVVGVGVGEIMVRYWAAGPVEIGVATAIATLLVAAFSTNPLTVIQAGVAATLVVGLHTPQAGLDRLFSALIGGVLALLVSQVLVTPSPVATLSTAARTALTPAVRGLRSIVRALTEADPATAYEALELVRGGHGELTAFETARTTSRDITHRTVRGYRQRHRTRQLDARLGDIYSVYIDVVLIARAAQQVVRDGCEIPHWLLRTTSDLARAVEVLTDDPRSAENWRRAYDLAEPIARLDAMAVPHALAPLVVELRLAAADLVEVTRPDSG